MTIAATKWNEKEKEEGTAKMCIYLFLRFILPLKFTSFIKRIKHKNIRSLMFSDRSMIMFSKD